MPKNNDNSKTKSRSKTPLEFKIEGFSAVKEKNLQNISKNLSHKFFSEQLAKKTATALPILALVGAGAFLAASVAIPTLPVIIKPFLSNEDEKKAWKRFNLRYLKRTLDRLEKRQLVRFETLKNGETIVKITKEGQTKLLRLTLNEVEVKKPKFWNGDWYLVSYDIPECLKEQRQILLEYLQLWNFYPLHESMYLHAYPCEKEINFLREYLGIGESVRLFVVRKIENDQLFRAFFGV